MRGFCNCFFMVCVISFLCTACSESKSDSPAPIGAGLKADFSGTPTSGPAPLDVTFTDLSTGTVDTYFWDFGDGETSMAANPFHTYAADGTYTVVLAVSGPRGTDNEVKTAYITVGSGGPGPGILDANFTANPTSGVAPLEVDFIDTSTPATSIISWSWDFGDSGSSIEQNPTYEYTVPGTYTVSLTVSDGVTDDTETKTDYIVVNDTPTGTGDWAALTSGTGEDLYGISFASATVGWAVGTNDTLLYTDNGGSSWTSQFGNISSSVRYTKDLNAHILGSMTPNPGNSHLMDVHATSTTTAWVSSYGPCHGLDLTPCFVTTNGGSTWTCVITATNFQEWAIHAFDGSSARVATIGSAGHPDSDVFIIEGGYCTDHFPVTWGGLYAIGFGDASTGWTGGQDFYKSTNGGTSWSEISKPSGTGTILDICAISATCAWACSTDGKIIYTTNGTTWDSQTSGVTEDLWGIDFIDANNGWCVGGGGKILVTTNGGTTWTPTDSGTTSTLTDVSAVDASNVWACGASGIILKSQ